MKTLTPKSMTITLDSLQAAEAFAERARKEGVTPMMSVSSEGGGAYRVTLPARDPFNQWVTASGIHKVEYHSR